MPGEDAPVGERADLLVVVVARDRPGVGVGVIEPGTVGREAHPIGDVDPFEHRRQRTVRVEAVEPPQAFPRRHRAAEDPAPRVGDDVVEARVPLVGDLVEHRRQPPLAPEAHRAPRPEEQERAVGLDREPADDLALVALLVVAAGRVVAEEAPGGDVGPVDPPLGRVPQRPLPGHAGIIGEQFRFGGHRPPFVVGRGAWGVGRGAKDERAPDATLRAIGAITCLPALHALRPTLTARPPTPSARSCRRPRRAFGR